MTFILAKKTTQNTHLRANIMKLLKSLLKCPLYLQRSPPIGHFPYCFGALVKNRQPSVFIYLLFLILFHEWLHRSLSWITENRSSNFNNLDNVQKQVEFFFFLRKLLIVYRISSMTYFNKYLDIYRYSRNGTFLFFSSNCFTFLYKPKYLPFYLCSCKISLLRLMKNKKDLLILFFSSCFDVHTQIISIISSIFQFCKLNRCTLCQYTTEASKAKLRPFQLVQIKFNQ